MKDAPASHRQQKGHSFLHFAEESPELGREYVSAEELTRRYNLCKTSPNKSRGMRELYDVAAKMPLLEQELLPKDLRATLVFMGLRRTHPACSMDNTGRVNGVQISNWDIVADAFDVPCSSCARAESTCEHTRRNKQKRKKCRACLLSGRTCGIRWSHRETDESPRVVETPKPDPAEVYLSPAPKRRWRSKTAQAIFESSHPHTTQDPTHVPAAVVPPQHRSLTPPPKAELSNSTTTRRPTPLLKHDKPPKPQVPVFCVDSRPSPCDPVLPVTPKKFEFPVPASKSSSPLSNLSQTTFCAPQSMQQSPSEYTLIAEDYTTVAGVVDAKSQSAYEEALRKKDAEIASLKAQLKNTRLEMRGLIVSLQKVLDVLKLRRV
ncbi:hypothetical protein CYLTODRAFT_418525 [Cylindrobasidium torrendii FP15055 ss-10]|uniref:Zn(2)-C6 fungal-type domain-containing protein n=1 Tax=Cylindrobasidium torrendii FP15055 ss-10 TaxID=1314674 RepID=A0A0D7BQD7_9AGAR|nr:hypothetical protein CYLTODRAFT_418525 [Cylindrobasidium torrendii FP15055 ss-10]